MTKPIVNFVSRQIAEAFVPGTGGFAHLISISDPDVTPRLAEGWADVLHLRFHDLDPNNYPGAKFPHAVLPSVEHCTRVLEFGRACLARGENVLVHCEAGVSRSGATALALEALGFDLNNRTRANCANLPMVLMFGQLLGRSIELPEARFEGTLALWG